MLVEFTVALFAGAQTFGAIFACGHEQSASAARRRCLRCWSRLLAKVLLPTRVDCFIVSAMTLIKWPLATVHTYIVNEPTALIPDLMKLARKCSLTTFSSARKHCYKGLCKKLIYL
jgi:hypothetical protein